MPTLTLPKPPARLLHRCCLCKGEWVAGEQSPDVHRSPAGELCPGLARAAAGEGRFQRYTQLDGTTGRWQVVLYFVEVGVVVPGLRATAEVIPEQSGLHVVATWEGHPLDRPHGLGWLLPAGSKRLAQRLKKAVDAGAVFKNPRVVHDNDGKTYVTAEVQVYAKWLSRDLRKLGF